MLAKLSKRNRNRAKEEIGRRGKKRMFRWGVDEAVSQVGMRIDEGVGWMESEGESRFGWRLKEKLSRMESKGKSKVGWRLKEKVSRIESKGKSC